MDPALFYHDVLLSENVSNFSPYEGESKELISQARSSCSLREKRGVRVLVQSSSWTK